MQLSDLVGPGIVHELCGKWHWYATDDTDLIICCACGHAHRPEGGCLADGPCGSDLCCQPPDDNGTWMSQPPRCLPTP